MIAIMQPTFLPWIGYFKMIASVEKFIFLDNVQFERHSWQSRNKIKLENKEFLLTLSCQKAPLKTMIKDIKLDKNQKWKNKLLKTLIQAYSKSINFEKYFPYIEKTIKESSNLADLNTNLIAYFCKELGIKTPLFRTSELNIDLRKKEKGLVDICNYFNDNLYLSTQGSKDYLEKDEAKKLFENEKIIVKYFTFNHPIYKQLEKNFIDHLSIVDFLFNEKNVAKKFLEFTRI